MFFFPWDMLVEAIGNPNTNIHTCILIYIRTCLHACLSTHRHVLYVYMHVYLYIQISMSAKYISIDTHVHTHIDQRILRTINTCMLIHIQTCIHACFSTNTHVHIIMLGDGMSQVCLQQDFRAKWILWFNFVNFGLLNLKK